ncbi:M-phase inducer phosphatase 1-like isoform X3 [Polyodon spathula]|uniref:M-phase inducer phosphatase 1-like isoform X2 n=1 Tax=Polyodon spathula TaxID=7913 RepID=UPI001B7F2260|nr:M-phase inducer phosphatase 1-like isoform X2 [Polyodon spathula]XP_041123846.1 M-phase inducer phosphatase 1-like isoform X3 [Polyodon spathula]
MDSPVGPEIESKAPRVGEMDCLWKLSPDLGLSPVSDLSVNMGNLPFEESTTPRRKLQLSPELLTPSPTPAINVSPETQMLTGCIVPQEPSGKRRGDRHSSPKNSMPKPRKQSGRDQLKKEENESRADKENRRCRVKLFTSPTAPKSKWKSGGRKSKSPESEELCNRSRKEASRESDPAIHRVPSFRVVQSRQQVPPVEMPDPSAEDRNRIGDFSRPHLLCVEKGDHQDLHYVSPQTVASVLRGEYSGAVERYLIIDCRYPYEYKGGHIRGSLNLHSESQLLAALLQEPTLSRSSPRAKLQESPSTQVMLQDNPPVKPILPDSPSTTAPEQESPPTRTALQESPPTRTALQESPPTRTALQESPPARTALQESPSTPATSKESALGRITVQDSSTPRTLLIFHCEFSSERGPRLCRFIRKIDRNLNVYPQLYYPEIYILKGGYKEFYTLFQSLCEPCGYVPMVHQDFADQLRRYRRKKRSRPSLFGRRKQLVGPGMEA